MLPENQIKPIETNLKNMNIKRTAGFSKAMQELGKHQDLLDRMSQELEAGDGTEPEGEGEEDDADDSMVITHSPLTFLLPW